MTHACSQHAQRPWHVCAWVRASNVFLEKNHAMIKRQVCACVDSWMCIETFINTYLHTYIHTGHPFYLSCMELIETPRITCEGGTSTLTGMYICIYVCITCEGGTSILTGMYICIYVCIICDRWNKHSDRHVYMYVLYATGGTSILIGMYVYMYVCLWRDPLHVRMCVFVRMYIHKHTYIHAYMHACICYVSCVCMCVCVHTFYVHVCVYIYIYIHIHTHIYTCANERVCKLM